jgi:hypothetical protein
VISPLAAIAKLARLVARRSNACRRPDDADGADELPHPVGKDIRERIFDLTLEAAELGKAVCMNGPTFLDLLSLLQ